mmetsp:Transcript_36733/g.84549  ORF Transcript_36733/g.84549 Transcript_36733/m.84549 type:complete len:217 (+) Transcript_36733:528-1178(+)
MQGMSAAHLRLDGRSNSLQLQLSEVLLACMPRDAGRIGANRCMDGTHPTAFLQRKPRICAILLRQGKVLNKPSENTVQRLHAPQSIGTAIWVTGDEGIKPWIVARVRRLEEGRPLYPMHMAWRGMPSIFHLYHGVHGHILNHWLLAQRDPKDAIHDQRKGNNHHHRLRLDCIRDPNVAGQLMPCPRTGQPVLRLHICQSEKCHSCIHGKNISSIRL